MVDQQQEREDKYDVSRGWGLPDLRDLVPLGGRIETAEFALDNTYFDTASNHLSQLGVTLRRREGGPDAGWHLKVPQGVTRNEITNSSDSASLPDDLAALVTGLRAGEELAPIAKVTVTRTVHRLLAEDDAVLIEVADDLVDAATMGEESRLTTWREVEVEVKPAGGVRLMKAVGKRFRAHGAVRSAYGSKLGRALGEQPTAAPREDGSVGALVADYVHAQCEEFVRCDLGLRLGEPEVHKFRVAIRRLRSTLRVFGPLFDAERVAQLEPDLIWLAGLLGEVRDRDVLRARLAEQVSELPTEMVLGPIASQIETTLLLERAEHLARVTDAQDGERYQTLMRQVMQWRTAPPVTKLGRKPASAVVKFVRTAERKVQKRLSLANGEVEGLHGARKAAKRYRYATELSAPAVGRSATKTVKETTKLQTQLGEHQDSVVSAAFLRRMAAAAGSSEGHNGFTYGILIAQEWQRAEEIQRDAGRRWAKKSGGKKG
ncbi:MAG TPA: CYTH and CHAD domain-containing protein [Propionibacteriaceae bacterium]